MPNLPTTMPPARLAIGIASRRLEPGGEHRGERGDHGVAGAGDVEHLARLGRQVERGRRRRTATCRPRSGSARAPSRPSDARSAWARSRSCASLDPAADHLGELGAVRRDRGGAARSGVVAALGIDEHRLAGGARQLDHARDVGRGRPCRSRRTAPTSGLRQRLLVDRLACCSSTSWSGSFSKSTRRSCCDRPMTRSLTMVVELRVALEQRLDAALLEQRLAGGAPARRRRSTVMQASPARRAP